MYNLLVGFPPDRVWGNRIGEYTDDALRAYVKPNGALDPSRVINLPTLIMPETQDQDAEQIAHIGALQHVTPDGTGDYRLGFVSDYTVHTSVVEHFAPDLGIKAWEFTRTHWAVKDVDLYRALPLELVLPEPEPTGADGAAPLAGRWAVDARPREPDLVAVMMPFHPAFDKVYQALSGAAQHAGLRCQRADDIWEHEHIIDDVVSLIWRAQVVIADLTGRNPNVFYEAGIAHAFGRHLVPIAQNLADVPSDLLAMRAQLYLGNDQGLGELQDRVAARLATLVGKP